MAPAVQAPACHTLRVIAVGNGAGDSGVKHVPQTCAFLITSDPVSDMYRPFRNLLCVWCWCAEASFQVFWLRLANLLKITVDGYKTPRHG